MRTLPRTLVLAALALSGVAAADRAITVDGNDAEWNAAPAVTTCFEEYAGDVSGGIDLIKVCVENNNGAGSNGSLFALWKASGPIPTSNSSWFGIAVDLNKDGAIDDNDELFAATFSAGGASTASSLQVFRAGSMTLKRTYAPNQSCAAAKGAGGWAARRNISTGTVELNLPYSCVGVSGAPQVPLAFNDDNRLMTASANLTTGSPGGVTDGAQYAAYNGTMGAFVPWVAPEVANLTALAQQGAVRLNWTNPAGAGQHRGVLVLRATGGAPTTAPVNGFAYTPGQTLGSATVVLADEAGIPTSFTDSGLTNGTRYYYRVYNHANNHTYAAGNVPGSTGIFAEPTPRTGTSPMWCYSTGFSQLVQPVTELGVAVYTGGNQAAITANLTIPGDPANDGGERFRPVALNGVVQNRFPVLPLLGLSGTQIVVGDQIGQAYAINAATGAFSWPSGAAGVPVGGPVQAQPVVQLNARSNAAFQAAHPGRDLIFFATRNRSPGNNRVVAVSSRDGAIVWTYRPGDLAEVNGGMMVDTARNRLWVASTTSDGSYDSLRVLDTVSGTEVARVPGVGDILHGVVRDFGLNTASPADDQAYVVNANGTIYGVDLGITGTATWVWKADVGPMSSYPFPAGSAFIASLKNADKLDFHTVDSTTGATTLIWSVGIPGPSGIRVDYVRQKLFVGSTDGNLYQVDIAGGVVERAIPLSAPGAPATQVWTPTIDPNTDRLHVGTADGRLCAFQLPFP